MKAHAKLNKPAGFTLLELIVSITLMAIIVLIVAGATTLGYRSFSSGEKKINAIERLRASLTIIDAQIQSGVPLTLEDGGVKQYYFAGQQDSLKFSTNHSIWGGQRGYVIVEYRVSTNEQGKKSLFASEYRFGMENKQETKLLDGFDVIAFEYFRQDVTEEEGEWATQWADEEMMPVKIRINLVQSSASLSYVVPVRVGGEIGALEDELEDESD